MAYLLRQKLNGRLISTNGDINWLPKSGNLTPLHYFPWESVKEKCYAYKPDTIVHLKTNIRDVIVEMRPMKIGLTE